MSASKDVFCVEIVFKDPEKVEESIPDSPIQEVEHVNTEVHVAYSSPVTSYLSSPRCMQQFLVRSVFD